MSDKKGFNWGGAIGGLAGGLLGMIGQGRRAEKQHNRQKELMGIQLKNQQELNEQGQKLQMKTWNDTGYGAQMDMMKEAGLNPGLMYGMSGGGGQTTGSQGGGSAQSGNSHAPMDIGASVQAGLMMAQAKKLNAETDAIESNTRLDGFRESEMVKRTVLLAEQGVKENMENDVKWQTLGDEVKKIKMEALNEELETQLNKVNKELTEEQTRALSHKMWQEWVKAGSFATGALSGIIGKGIKEIFGNLK